MVDNKTTENNSFSLKQGPKAYLGLEYHSDLKVGSLDLDQ